MTVFCFFFYNRYEACAGSLPGLICGQVDAALLNALSRMEIYCCLISDAGDDGNSAANDQGNRDYR